MHYSINIFQPVLEVIFGKEQEKILFIVEAYFGIFCFANLSFCSIFEKFCECGLRLSNLVLLELLNFHPVWRWFYNSKKSQEYYSTKKGICTPAAEMLWIFFLKILSMSANKQINKQNPNSLCSSWCKMSEQKSRIARCSPNTFWH